MSRGGGRRKGTGKAGREKREVEGCGKGRNYRFTG
jgi:hypothetical protein